MPRTLANTGRILAELESADLGGATLLVVPGARWDQASLSELRRFTEAGAQLAGHGWRHEVENIRGIRHRLHSLLISRNVAEHLALSRDDTVALMKRCYEWFSANDLPEPTLYVPPAWAMGRVRYSDLEALPYEQYETMGGVYDTRSKRFRRTPMIGFEADTGFRALSCRIWNWANLTWAGTSRPVRVAIHPNDFELRLAEDVHEIIREGGRALSYSDLN